MLTLVLNCFGRQQDFCLLESLPDLKAGSMPGNHIYLPYKGVSRRHFKLIRREGDWVLMDLGSRNGTFVNGRKTEEAVIHPGDEIAAGTVKLLVKEAAADSETIFLNGARSPEHRRDTDELKTGSVTAGAAFYFPQLVFPEEMIPGRSPTVLEVYRKLHSIAGSDVSVLFIGETGCGKEMLARVLHLSGPRAAGPFVAINCAAIPADLAESELLGIGERVATNVSRRVGKLELAHHGTLFLDELSSFAVTLQTKILRAVEERIVYPVGENSAHPADFRVLAASNEEPEDLIETGRMRKDLYHRIAAVEIRVPPLRQRQEDIETLFLGLIAQMALIENKPVPGVRRSVIELLRKYSCPGNVRELANIAKSMVALANPGEILDDSMLPEKVQRAGVSPAGVTPGLSQRPLQLHAHLDDVTRALVEQALELKDGNITQAAEHLGVTPRGLRKMMQRLGLQR